VAGEDGELHIGAFNPNIIANNDEMPVSSPRNENDPGWGIVSEFPNARRGNGPMLFSQATGSITFTGYLRLWNEGHDHGQVNEQSTSRAGSASRLGIHERQQHHIR